MKILSVILLILVLGSGIINAQTQAEEAAGLLSQLTREAQQSLRELDDYWQINFPILKGIMDSQQQEFYDLEAECKDRESAIGDTEQDIENAKHYIEWIGEKIQSNLARIEKLEDAHCETSKLYINGLKHSKLALSLIQFMRQAIQQKDDLSLVQKRAIVGQMSVFFQLYSKDNTDALSFLQQDFTVDTTGTGDVSQRSDDQVGDGHVDDNREQIDLEQFVSSQRKNWPQYKADLLNLLDKLEEEIKANMQESQDDEIQAGVTLAEYKIQLEKENQELDRHLAAQAERITRLEGRTKKQHAYWRECMDELNIVFEGLLEARSAYNDKIDQHNAKRSGLADEVELFEKVEIMYTQNVNANGEYEEREVDSFDILG